MPLAFSLAADKTGHPLAFEPEGSPSDEALAWNVLTWGQYKFRFVPMVDRYRWLEPRHQVNISDRWNRDKTDDLQFAFFNGEGWESWENIWGIWNGITPRDAEATRRVATIERAVAPFFSSTGMGAALSHPCATASLPATGRWGNRPCGPSSIAMNTTSPGGRSRFRTPRNALLRSLSRHRVDARARRGSGRSELSHRSARIRRDARDSRAKPGPEFVRLMEKMKPMTAKPLASLFARVEAAAAADGGDRKVKARERRSGWHDHDPGGRLRIQGARASRSKASTTPAWTCSIRGKISPRRYHEHKMHITPFYIDKYPVTNAEFKKFLDATHYHPADDLNFLKDWKNGTYPARMGEQARDLGFARGCARLCQVGWQAPAA